MMRFLISSTLVAFALAISVACSSTSDPGPPTSTVDGDGGTTPDGAAAASSSGSSGAPAACTTLTQLGTSIDILATRAAQPDPKGGTPVDGVYALTAIRAFTTIFAEGGKVKTFGAYTLSIKGTKFEQTVTNGDGVTTIASGDLTSSDVSFTATPSCQQPASADGGVDIISGHFTAGETDDPDDGGIAADASTGAPAPTVLKMYVVQLGITAELLFIKK